jgi:glucokinase
MILAGDIGGTNSRLALFDSALQLVAEWSTLNAGRGGLPEVVREFLATLPPAQRAIRQACFGVAGPVSNGQVILTNLQWHMTERQLAEDLGIPRLALINDMIAHGEGLELLKEEHRIVLHPGIAPFPDPTGTRALIAAGTGLGEGGTVYDFGLKGHRAFASEGGHADFGPSNELEDQLLRYLRARSPFNGHVSWEQVLSGRGLRNLYDFFISPGQLGPAAALPQADPAPPAITAAALAGDNPAATAALELFIRFYGAEAGNLAVKLLATGGVYVGGGIAPRLVKPLQSPAFFEAFYQKGPVNLQAVLKQMPIYLITNDQGALYGAANYAHRL